MRITFVCFSILFSLVTELVNAMATYFDEDYVFVTSFYNIGRGEWGNRFSRSTEIYLSRFSLLVQLNLPLIVFIDERYFDHVEIIVNKHSENVGLPSKTKIISINEDFLLENIPSWRYVPVEESIMLSDDFQALAQMRGELDTPETQYAAYNCINHAKVDFAMLAIKHCQNNNIPLHYIGWVDFGYVSEPFEVVPFSMNKQMLFNDKVNFLSYGAFAEREKDPLYVFLHVPIKVHGAFWFGSVGAVLVYHELYHECVRELHMLNMADDDQSVDICCYFKRKEIFKMWKNEIWAVLDQVPQILWYLAFVVFNTNFPKEVVVEKFSKDNSII